MTPAGAGWTGGRPRQGPRAAMCPAGAGRAAAGLGAGQDGGAGRVFLDGRIAGVASASRSLAGVWRLARTVGARRRRVSGWRRGRRGPRRSGSRRRCARRSWPSRCACRRGAGDVVDEIREGLRHGGAGPAGEQGVQVGGGVAGVEAAADRFGGDAVNAGGLLDAEQLELAGEVGSGRAGDDDGQVGLQQDVVDRGGRSVSSSAAKPVRAAPSGVFRPSGSSVSTCRRRPRPAAAGRSR